jgi:hypothetical protein
MPLVVVTKPGQVVSTPGFHEGLACINALYPGVALGWYGVAPLGLGTLGRGDRGPGWVMVVGERPLWADYKRTHLMNIGRVGEGW